MPVPIIQLPEDATVEERKIANFAYANIYSLIPDPIDKFIVAFVFDLGNSVLMTAIALGLSRITVHRRTQKIKHLLENAKLTPDIFDNTLD